MKCKRLGKVDNRIIYRHTGKGKIDCYSVKIGRTVVAYKKPYDCLNVQYQQDVARVRANG